MRLLRTEESCPGRYEVETYLDNDIPPYAILSHTWGDGELTFQDVEAGQGQAKPGFEKLQRCCAYAKANGFDHIWNDTCCIDKTSSAELSEAINSMFQWYENAEVCYAYLHDVPFRPFADSRWFTRGWTLQELIAPMSVIFLDKGWNMIGSKETMKDSITTCTGIPGNILDGDDLETASVAQRMSWAAKRETTRVEDRAYSLIGLFGVNIPMLYGEGERAFIRLQEEIFRISDDHSLFAWRSSDDRGGLFASYPEAFADSGDVITRSQPLQSDGPPVVSNRGLHMELPFLGIGHSGLGLAILSCTTANDNKRIALYLRDEHLTMQSFRRVRTRLFEHLDLASFTTAQRPLRRICVRLGHSLKLNKRFLRKTLNERGGSGFTPFIRPNLTESIDVPFWDLRDALLEAAGGGDEHRVRQLLWPGTIKAGVTYGGGMTLLHHAACGGYTGLVWLLMTRADVVSMAVDSDGQSVLTHAAKNGHEALVKVLLARRDTQSLQTVPDCSKYLPISHACRAGHESVVKLLLEDIKWEDLDGDVTRWCTVGLARIAYTSGHMGVLEMLLDTGRFSISKYIAYPDTGPNLLFWAVENGKVGTVEMLLSGEFSINAARRLDGMTPLMMVVKRRRVDFVRLLVANGAKVDAVDKQGRTAFMMAEEAGMSESILQLLRC